MLLCYFYKFVDTTHRVMMKPMMTEIKIMIFVYFENHLVADRSPLAAARSA